MPPRDLESDTHIQADPSKHENSLFCCAYNLTDGTSAVAAEQPPLTEQGVLNLLRNIPAVGGAAFAQYMSQLGQHSPNHFHLVQSAATELNRQIPLSSYMTIEQLNVNGSNIIRVRQYGLPGQPFTDIPVPVPAPAPAPMRPGQ